MNSYVRCKSVRLLSLGILWNEKNDDVSPMCNSKIQNKTKV